MLLAEQTSQTLYDILGDLINVQITRSIYFIGSQEVLLLFESYHPRVQWQKCLPDSQHQYFHCIHSELSKSVGNKKITESNMPLTFLNMIYLTLKCIQFRIFHAYITFRYILIKLLLLRHKDMFRNPPFLRLPFYHRYNCSSSL